MSCPLRARHGSGRRRGVSASVGQCFCCFLNTVSGPLTNLREAVPSPFYRRGNVASETTKVLPSTQRKSGQRGGHGGQRKQPFLGEGCVGGGVAMNKTRHDGCAQGHPAPGG